VFEGDAGIGQPAWWYCMCRHCRVHAQERVVAPPLLFCLLFLACARVTCYCPFWLTSSFSSFNLPIVLVHSLMTFFYPTPDVFFLHKLFSVHTLSQVSGYVFLFPCPSSSPYASHVYCHVMFSVDFVYCLHTYDVFDSGPSHILRLDFLLTCMLMSSTGSLLPARRV
jgi:hypothetical protein